MLLRVAYLMLKRLTWNDPAVAYRVTQAAAGTEILEHLPTPETETSRKAPFALVRAARSGKTRCLQELTVALRRRGVAAVMISFNGSTELAPEEDLSVALWRRVTYALRAEPVRFDRCGEADVQKWLAECALPAVLLVDELNRAVDPIRPSPSSSERALVRCVKDHFLSRNRLLVFSSHVNDTVNATAPSLLPSATASPRAVKLLSPPLAEDAEQVAEAFGTTVEAVILNGRVLGHIADPASCRPESRRWLRDYRKER